MSFPNQKFEENLGDLFVQYLVTCSPEQIHKIVSAWDLETVMWNFVRLKKPLAWIINSPKTDRGTALNLFWSLEGPSIFSLLESLDERELEENEYKEVLGFIKILMKNYSSGFYKNQEFSYIPPEPSEIDELSNAIPKEMYLPLAGKRLTEHAKLEEGFPAIEALPMELQNKYTELEHKLEK
jgi:hypothetical protein